jgi:molybdopterin-binding protein
MRLKISARNCIKGTIESVDDGIVTSKVKIKIEAPTTITAVVTKEAVRELGLKKGDKAFAIIKSTSVMVGKD